MEGECKVMLDSSVETEARKETSHRLVPSSKLTTALLVFTLCLATAAAAVLVLNRKDRMGAQEQKEDSSGFSGLHHTLRQISNVRAAIHLEGEANPAIKTSIEWKKQVDQSHSQGGLDLVNNEIVIPRNGLYFVYCQASFQVSCSTSDPDDTNSMVYLSHIVQRRSKTYANDDTNQSYHTILRSVRTACQKTTSSNPEEDGSWYSAVYNGAVFSLNEGDRLRTEMAEEMLAMVEEGSGKNFFGVFAL
ncbi:tumor necrosis factor a (TNF superfamily, member 2) [Parambassis ranga]|uniref:Lymphotoxin-alpha n=1 Tax=Parambassis ranga TaxID=210632 RepID=A0A6P7HH85_9TELE|nr:tumor necrosis factor-like [Parambassis ranga]